MLFIWWRVRSLSAHFAILSHTLRRRDAAQIGEVAARHFVYATALAMPFDDLTTGLK